ncbi:MAG: hypothetical protein ACOCXG_04590 [Nanoarchaeota archaeon]
MIFKSQNKIQSRNQAIISPYQQTFGRKIPKNKQYWTLCADCTNENNEFQQLLSTKLIKPNQFHGVDIDRESILKNKKLGIGNFHLGDFYGTIANHKSLNPAVVNLDFLRTFQSEKNNIRRIFLLLTEYENLLFSFNVLIKSRHVEYRDPKEIIDFLIRDPDIRLAQKKWEPQILTYSYRGLGPGTEMASVTLFKKKS